MNNVIRNVFNRNLINKKVASSYTFSTGVVYRNSPLVTSHVHPTYQPVADFYAGKSVFITGGTGFVGRVLIERLLFTCKDLDKVYVLIRPKNDTNIHQRIQKLLHNPIFNKLNEKRPQDLTKIVPIAGDVGNVRLGINVEDEQTLIEKVSVIFHSAANVKLRSSLSDLMQVNYEGTKHVMELGQKIKNLDVLVHVSTVFNNSNLVVDEFPQPPPRNLKDTYRTIENHRNNPEEIRKLLDRWGNSYVISKKMAEAYVASNYGNIPTVIVRPSIVTSIYKEPLPGYVDSWAAGTVLLCDIASGLARVVHGKGGVVAEIIPADYVCNFVIIAAAKNSKRHKCNVYNISTGHSNPIEWQKLCDDYIKESKTHGYGVMPFPKVYFTKTRWAIAIMIFLTQIVPAFTADVWLRLTGRQPRYMKLQKKVISRTVLSRPLTESSWDIRTTRARGLISTLSNEDKTTFPCDPVSIEWDRYVPIYCKGVKDYMLSNSKKK